MNTRLFVLVLVVAVVAAACSSSGDDAASPTDPATTATTVVPTTVEAAPTTEVAGSTVGDWTAIPGGDDCRCSDGSEFEVWERQGDPTKVVLFFQGGGACFSAETCGPESRLFERSITIGEAPDFGGIFDETNPENPLAGHSVVYVPYCTGDVHLGNRVTEYSDTVTIDHNGFTNARKGLDTVLANYPDVEQLVVAGASAGSIPTPAFAGLAADELPDTEIVTLGDSSAAYPDVPALNAGIGGLWGVLENVPDWPVNEGLTPEEWSLPGLYVQAGMRHPEITFARFDYAFDRVQAGFVALAGVQMDDLVSFIDQTEADIEAKGVPVASYVAPGDTHTILLRDQFYDLEVDGVRLVDFVATLVAGGVPADVRCTECR
ncbi:MAG TPA: pectin acetylesterase-family hydrolase [Ilumatobacteraceae bacterium]|nr:pectin acetylesterase-family hydrolase [Ilumatobacteraceae bacterium]